MNTTKVDLCVIGSGFGAGPAALRGIQSGRSVLVLEQGHRYDGRPGSRAFRQTQGDLDYLMELFAVDAAFDPARSRLNAVVGGRGLGGGSLVYSMVSLRAPSFVFDADPWPTEVNRATLDPFYDLAETQLGVTQVTWDGDADADGWRMASKRDAAFAAACAAAGVSCDPVPLAINRSCGNLGWCTTGCVRHGKNSVDLRYLQPAEDLGATLRLGVKAQRIDPAPATSGRRWQVQLIRRADGQQQQVLCDEVVVAAGAVGSPTVLLNSAAALPGGISSQCGKHLSRGGDILIPVLLPDELGFEDLEILPGKIIGSCSFHHLFEPPFGHGPSWQPFVIQPMMILPVISALVVADPDGITSDGGDMRSFGLGHKHLMQKWGTRLLHLGVMGVDGMDGEITLSGGAPNVRFATSPATAALQQGAFAAVRHIFETTVGGRLIPSWEQLPADGLTIHPLGSCRMAPDPDRGVVDHRCRVFRSDGSTHPGLYVMDASTFSSPVAVNTSLTAAAISERAMALIDT
jgi:cholesterol oxidase